MGKYFRVSQNLIINRLFTIWTVCLLFFATLIHACPVHAFPIHAFPINEERLVETQQYLFQWNDHITSTKAYAGSFWRFTGNKRHFQDNIQSANLSQFLVMKWHAKKPQVQGLICIGHQQEDSPGIEQRFHDDAVTFTRLHKQHYVDVFRVNFHSASGSSEIIITDGQLIPECTERFHDQLNQDTQLTLMMNVYEHQPALHVKKPVHNETFSPLFGMEPSPSKPVLTGSASASPTNFQDPKPHPGRGMVFLDFIVTILSSALTTQDASPFNQERQDNECKNKICILIRHGLRRWLINISNEDWELLRQHGALSSPSILLLLTQQLSRSRATLSQLQSDLQSLLEQTPCPDLSLWQEAMDIPPDQIHVSHWLESFYRQQILELAGLEINSSETSDQSELLEQLRNLIHELILQQRLQSALTESALTESALTGISDTPPPFLTPDTDKSTPPASSEALQRFLNEKTSELWQHLLAQGISSVITPSPTVAFTLVQLPMSSAATQPQPTNGARPITYQRPRVRPTVTGNDQPQGQSQGQKRDDQPPLEDQLARQSLHDTPDPLPEWLNEPIQRKANQILFTIPALLTALGRNQQIFNDFFQMIPVMEPGQSEKKLMSESNDWVLKKGFFSKGIILTLYWIRYGKSALSQQPFISENSGSVEILAALEKKGFNGLRSLIRYPLPASFLDFLETMTSLSSNSYQLMMAAGTDLASIYHQFRVDSLSGRARDQHIQGLTSLVPLRSPPSEDLLLGEGEGIKDNSILSININSYSFFTDAKHFFNLWQSSPGSIAKIDGEDLHLFSSRNVTSNTPSQIIHWIKEHKHENWDWLERKLGLSDVVQSTPFSQQPTKVLEFSDQLDFNEYQWFGLFTRALRDILPEGIRTREAISVELGVANWRWEYNPKEGTFKKRNEPHIAVFQIQKPELDELTSIWYSLENIYLLSGVIMGLLKDWRSTSPPRTRSLKELFLKAEGMSSSWLLSHHNIERTRFYQLSNRNTLLKQTPRYHGFFAAKNVEPLIMALYPLTDFSSGHLITMFKLTTIEPTQLEQLILWDLASPPQHMPEAHADPVGKILVKTSVNYQAVKKRLVLSSPAVNYLDRQGKTHINIDELYAILHFFEHPEFDFQSLTQNSFQARIINDYLKRQHSEIMTSYFNYFRHVNNELDRLNQYSLQLKDFTSRLPESIAKELRLVISPRELLHTLRTYNLRLYSDLIERLRLDYQHYQQEQAPSSIMAAGDCPYCVANPDGGATNLQPILYSQLAPAYCDKEERRQSCGACDQCGTTLFKIDYVYGRDYVGSPVIANCAKHNVDICQNCLKGVNCPACKASMKLTPALIPEYVKEYPEGYELFCDKCGGFISNVDSRKNVSAGSRLLNRCTGQDKHDICQSCVIAQSHNLPAHSDQYRRYAFHYEFRSPCTHCSEHLPIDAPVVDTINEGGSYTGFYHTQCINQTDFP